MKRQPLKSILAAMFLMLLPVTVGAQIEPVVRRTQTTTTNTTTTTTTTTRQNRPVRRRTTPVTPTPQPADNNSSAAVETITVNGVSFNMVRVEGGTFTMGATPEQGSDAFDDEKPSHRVTLSTFSIGETEVTQQLWQAVMGSNPSNFKGAKRPVEQVSWEDCQIFIRELNRLTGRQFRLPTEAEWEFAARGGNKSNGCKYAGSNRVANVAWYRANSDHATHDVKTKQANELGLYDMSGNVWEWCQDWSGIYTLYAATNPTGPSDGSFRVSRGGDWSYLAEGSRVSKRYGMSPSHRSDSEGLRLALTSTPQPVIPTPQSVTPTPQPADNDSTAAVQTITVNGVSFKMVRVEGGTFTMGATAEQGSDAYDGEKPSHRVTLSTFRIGETEVTQQLWKAVIGRNPSICKGAQHPVECVSWEDCQIFISELNRLTGRKFRLPTEAEWEFAARGGNKSNGCKYAGSNSVANVAWYDDNSGDTTHDVKTKQANELGLYDMSGNVYEWCQDWYGSYSSSAATNPTGPSSGSGRVNRGGGYYLEARSSRVSKRSSDTPTNRDARLGLRLAL